MLGKLCKTSIWAASPHCLKEMVAGYNLPLSSSASQVACRMAWRFGLQGLTALRCSNAASSEKLRNQYMYANAVAGALPIPVSSISKVSSCRISRPGLGQAEESYIVQPVSFSDIWKSRVMLGIANVNQANCVALLLLIYRPYRWFFKDSDTHLVYGSLRGRE